MAALEPLGFTVGIAGQSSYRGGIHLYLPFEKAQNSWELAACLSTLLENAGFKLKPGQLEVFPNPRPFSSNGKPALFNAHRLPMQAGFYLLNEDFQPIWSDRSTFVKRWHFAASRNTVTTKLLRQLLKQHKRRHYRISGKADKFLNDLDTEIEQGWTAYGQTNRLLGRIALRTYIFHHVIQGGDPLTGQALVDQVVAVARSLPGYQDWCRHQHEIEDRAVEWARCAEASRYFHYTHRSAVQTTCSNSRSENPSIDRLTAWNQQQSQTTREKICSAIADLLESNRLPAKPTARFQALLRYGIGGASLYRHRDLWHPSESGKESGESNEFIESNTKFNESVENLPSVENPPHPPTSSSARPSDQLDAGSDGLSCTSLFPGNGSNINQSQASSDRTPSQTTNQIQQVEHSYQSRLHHYLSSGDPILVAEAKLWQRSDRTSQSRNQLHNSFRNQSAVPTAVPTAVPSVDPFDDPSAAQEFSPSVTSSTLVSTSVQLEASTSSPLPTHSPPRFFSCSQDVLRDIPQDLSDLLAAISVQLRRLHWTHSEIRDRLMQRYRKLSRAMLTQDELLDWLNWLKSQK